MCCDIEIFIILSYPSDTYVRAVLLRRLVIRAIGRQACGLKKRGFFSVSSVPFVVSDEIKNLGGLGVRLRWIASREKRSATTPKGAVSERVLCKAHLQNWLRGLPRPLHFRDFMV